MATERISIWFLIGNLSVGGAERTLVDLAGGLDQERFDVTIWTIENSGPLRDAVPGHVAYRTLDAAGKWDLRAPLRFLRAARREQPDIVQSFLFFDNVLARMVALGTSAPAVITGVRAVPNDRPLLRRTIDRVTMTREDVIVSNSEAGREFVVARGADPSKVRVIHNGRDLEAYATGEATAELYAELGLEQGRPVVGTVGRLLERKGHFDLLEAWPRVLQSHPDAQLLIVGDGPEAGRLRERAASIGCADSINIPGRRDDIPAVLDLIDVFVFPSHFEGLPGALLEAMAARKPIVTTPVDGNSELVLDGEHGIHVPPKDPEKLAEAINRLVVDEEYAATLGENAAERVATEFSLSRMIGEFVELYETTTT